MEVRTGDSGGGAVLRPAGRLDGPGAKKFRQLAAALHHDPPPLVVDLGETTALLAAGAEALLWLVRRHRAANVPLAFARPGTAALRLLQASGLAALVPVRATVAAARTALNLSPPPLAPKGRGACAEG